MAQILVRNLDEGVKARLKNRARERGRSMEEEARAILTDAVASAADRTRQYGLGSEIAAMFKSVGLTKDEARGFEKRGHYSKPAKFD